MVKLKIRRPVALVGAVVMLLNSVGCSINLKTANANNISHTVSFSWWGNGERHSYTLDAIDIFEDINDSIKVKRRYGNWNGYSKRQNIYMKSNEAPDVMQINFSWLSEYSKDGNGFYNLNDLSEYLDLSGYTETELSYGTVNDKLNAIPIALNAETTYYNKDIYDAYSLDLPKTWDDLFEAAKIMSKDGIYPIGFGDKACFFVLLAYMEQTTGHKACNEDGELVLTKDDIKVMLEFYKRLFDEKVIQQVDQYNLNYFLSGKCAGTVGWVSDAENYCAALVKEGANIVVGEYPVVEGASTMGWYIKPATLYAISKNTEEPETAARLLDYLINSSEMAHLQKFEKGVPISDKAQEALADEGLTDGLVYEANQKMSDNQNEMNVISPVLEAENVYIAFKDEANYYLYNKKLIDEVADMVYNDFYNS